ncbi:hypothetical protein Tco_1310732 [Tanacetum coccineum]
MRKEHQSYCLLRSKFLKNKQVVEEEQTQPEYLQELLQSLLKDLQILKEIQPLKQETLNQIQKDQEEKSIVELLAEERLQKANQALNKSQSPQEIRIQDLEIRRAVLGECNLFDIDDSYYEKSTSRLAHLAPISPEIVEACVDDDDTDDDYDYDDNVYVDDIEEDGGEINLDISKIVDISLREKLVKSYLLIEKVNAFSLSPPIPISPIFCPSSAIPVVDFDLPLEEADVPSFSDDSMIFSEEFSFSFENCSFNDSLPLPENESYNLNSVDNPESPVVKSCFDFEPVVAVTNDFDVLNDVESFDSGEGENVDSLNVEEEDSFTFTIRTFLPFVTYPEVLPTSYSTGSEDKVFKPGIFDNDAFKDKSSKELAPSKALLTLDIFDPLHPPLMNF